MIASGEKALDIARTLDQKLNGPAAVVAAAGTIVRLADLVDDLINLRDEQTAVDGTGHEEAVEFTEAVLRCEERIILAYSGWRDIFQLNLRYRAASGHLR